jgi:uncharacterized protein (TIGR02996 family)
MDNAQSLLQAIQDDPSDELAHQALADWCDEQGDPAWAEFIRVGCTLARPGLEDAHRQSLAAREQELWRQHHDRWLAPFAARAWKAEFTFQRGLIRELHLSNASGTLIAARTQQQQQDLEELQQLLRRPIAGAVQSLQIRASRGFPLAQFLAAAPTLAGLRELKLAYPNMGDAGLAALAGSPHLGNLRRLCIVDAFATWYSEAVTTRGLRALAASGSIRILHDLELT